MEHWFDLATPGGLVRLALVVALHASAALLLAPARMERPQDELMLVDFVSSVSAPAATTRPPMPAKASARPAPSPSLTPVPASSSSSAAIAEKAAPASTATGSPAANSSSSSATAAAGADSGAPVTEARYDADYLHNPKPPYPATSRRRGEEGRVVLKVLVKPDGSAGDVLLHKSSGFGLLDASARSTVARWRFAAARRGQDPVESWVLVPLVFSLDDQG